MIRCDLRSSVPLYKLFVILHVLSRPLTISIFLISKYFQANRDQHSIVANVINPPIIARFCRIVPRGWYRHISMRVEFYGCKAGIRNTLPYQEECSAFFTFSKELSKLIWLSPYTINPSYSTKPSTCKNATYRHSTPSSNQGVSQTIIA